MSQSIIPVVTEYVAVRPKSILSELLTQANIELLLHEVILQAQGETIELFDCMSSFTAVLSFSAVYDIADETVFRLTDGRLVLLFDHKFRQTFRPKEVNEIIWNKILKAKSKCVFVQDVATPIPEVVIDLIAIWSNLCKHRDIIVRTKFFIKYIIEELKPAIAIRLIGEIPNLPLLFAVYLARPYGHTVIFEDVNGVEVVLFYNL